MRTVRRVLVTVVLAALMAIALTVVSGMAGATNSSSCTFSKGQTTCTTTHGSHGSTDTHNGQVNSSGDQATSSTCKQTGSDQTNTC